MKPIFSRGGIFHFIAPFIAGAMLQGVFAGSMEVGSTNTSATIQIGLTELLVTNDFGSDSLTLIPKDPASTNLTQIFDPRDDKATKTIQQIGAEVRGMGTMTELPPMVPPTPKIGTADPLTLLKAVELTIKKNFTISQSRASVISSRGQLRQAAGPFDPTVSATVNGLYQPYSQNSSVTTNYAVPNYYYNPANASSLFSYNQNSLQNQGGLSETFRNGITVEAIEQTYQTALNSGGNSSGNGIGSSSSQGYNYSSGTVGLIVQIPLLRGLGYNSLNTATERAAKESLKSAECNLGFTMSQQICNTITAYWNCLQAQKSVQIAFANEYGSKQLAIITEALIKGYLQPLSSLVQARANYNSYLSQRIQAEQQQSVTSQQLAQILGLDPRELFNEPLVVGRFSLSDYTYDLQPSDIKKLVDIAMRCRLDIRAAKLALHADEILLKGLKNNALPQLNLSVGGGVNEQKTADNSGASQNGSSVNSAQNSSLYGKQIGAAISGEWPFGNDAAMGAVIKQKGQTDFAKTQVSLLESQAASLVITSAKSVINNKKALTASAAAARQQLESVKAQEKLFSMGMSSIVDVITTQTDYAGAELALISNQANYAIAIGQLRYATGTLICDTELSDSEKKLLPPIPGLPNATFQASYRDKLPVENH